MTPPLDPRLFDLSADHLWIMHCAEGPVPVASIEAVRALLHKETQPWQMRFPDDFIGIPRSARQGAAQIVGGLETDITLTPTTSSGLITIAQGLPWSHGDEVLLPLGEFPSNVWPWKCLEPRGVTVREVPLWDGHTSGKLAKTSTRPDARPGNFDPEQRILQAINKHTRVLSVSWVRFQDGLKLDLKRLAQGCKERGVIFVVDGIQGAGLAIPHLDGVAAFATGSQKGLLAPQGQGFLWTAPEFRARLTPPGGWLSLEDATDFSRPNTDFDRAWLSTGERLEQGGFAVIGCAALAASLKVLNQAGASAIEQHVITLQYRLLDQLSANTTWSDEAHRLLSLLDQRRLGPIISVAERAEVVSKASQHGIHTTTREGYLRIALHGFHTENDVDRIAQWLTSSV